jgi:multidrug efflux pump subunit AcrB
VPLGELAKVQEGTIDKNIYRKNQREAVYVTADVAGAEESPVKNSDRNRQCAQPWNIAEDFYYSSTCSFIDQRARRRPSSRAGRDRNAP